MWTDHDERCDGCGSIVSWVTSKTNHQQFDTSRLSARCRLPRSSSQVNGAPPKTGVLSDLSARAFNEFLQSPNGLDHVGAPHTVSSKRRNQMLMDQARHGQVRFVHRCFFSNRNHNTSYSNLHPQELILEIQGELLGREAENELHSLLLPIRTGHVHRLSLAMCGFSSRRQATARMKKYPTRSTTGGCRCV